MAEQMLDTNISRKANKGFTLVELFVVLVILAILAAILVPVLLGYIDKARQSSAIEECHMCVVAAQSVATEQYGKNSTFINSADSDQISEISKLADSEGKINSVDYIANDTQVSKLVYTATNGFVVTYTYTAGDISGKYTFGSKTADDVYQKENLSEKNASRTAVLNNLRAINSDVVEVLGDDWSTTFVDGQHFDLISGQTSVKLQKKDGSYIFKDFSTYCREFIDFYGNATKFTVKMDNGKLFFKIKGSCNSGIAGNAAATTRDITFTIDGKITGVDKITSFS
jgi:prepilin-type N-terminal cleavage/methylation domain-containing protein